MTSLTRDDAVARAALIAVDDYAVALDLTGDERSFGSTTTVRFTCREPGAETFLDVAAAELRGVRLNGRDLDPAGHLDADGRRLRLPDLGARNELSVDAVMSYSHDGEGLHRSTDPADGRDYVYAMSFLDAAPRWFACFDQPDLKAPVRLDVRCPEDWTVVGNGPARQVDPGHWQIAATGPLATYFTTLVAGPYHQVRDEHDGIPLVLHARQSLAEALDRDAAHLFEHTARCFDELHRLFGYRYPWGEYHQVFVADFNAGAMENPGCVTITDEYVYRSRATDAELANRDVTIAHEMAHMWFGDLVTMRWWDDLWLNESFAEYLGQRITGPQAWTQFGAERKSWGYAADRRPSTHPVAGNGAADTETALTEFDGISYAKGASALRQLAVHLGDETFLDGLRRYVQRHADGNAEFADLVRAWTEAGGRDLDAWTAAWLGTSGLDELAVEDATLVRTEPPDAPGRAHTIEVAGFDANGTERTRHPVRVSGERTELPPGTATGEGHLVLPDASDETWAKIRLDAPTWAAMPTTLAALSDERARVVVWNALRLAVEDAEVDPALAVDIVAAALPAESAVATLASVGRWAANRLTAVLLDGADRTAAVARLCGAARAVAGVAAPGSGRQLAAARIALACTADPAVLRGWLAGDGVPDGLVVDAELRWSIVTRLAQLGALTGDELAAERQADHSSRAEVNAARCAAAQPDAEGKARAWRTMMTDPDPTNSQLYALAEGFWQPDQRELTAEYVPRYFAEIAATSRLRSGWVVERLAALAYPWTAVDPATVDATGRLLAEGDLPAGVRRSVLDAGDDLRRAVEIRRRFA